MIVVVEGASAVGKTTLLRHLPPAQVVGEDWAALGFPRDTSPDPHTPAGLQFGLDMLARRWELLCAAASRYGRSYGDTDPLKLYYDFALAATGRMPRATLDEVFRLHRQSMIAQRIGFADHVVFLWAAPQIIAQRKSGDSTRQRRNFALHQSMSSMFATYYDTLERLRPGTVHRLDAVVDPHKDFVQLLQSLAPSPHNPYDVALLDQLQEQLTTCV